MEVHKVGLRVLLQVDTAAGCIVGYTADCRVAGYGAGLGPSCLVGGFLQSDKRSGT